MELGRRGFLSVLGGLVMGRAVGPLVTPAPGCEDWKRITDPAMPRTPVRNVYLPLEAVCAKTIEVLASELKWLRLSYEVSNMEYGMEELRVRPVDWGSFRSDGGNLYTVSYNVIPIKNRARCVLREPIREYRSLDEIEAHEIVPAAQRLAEEVIAGIRRNGGGERFITPILPVSNYVERCVISTNRELGISLRGAERYGGDARHVTMMEIAYGIG